MTAISVLSFTMEPLEFPWGTDLKIVPLIDERDLVDWVAEYERWHDFHMPGAYAGLWPKHEEKDSTVEYLMWNMKQGVPCERRLLGCNCSVPDCWPLLATISLTDGRVIWDQFRQPFRPEQDYSAFGPIVFKRDQYVNAVRALLVKIGTIDPFTPNPDFGKMIPSESGEG